MLKKIIRKLGDWLDPARFYDRETNKFKVAPELERKSLEATDATTKPSAK